MANLYTAVIPQILAQGLMVLRENCILPRLVNTDLSTDAKEFGDTIDVPFVGKATAVTVAPANIFTAADITTSKVQVSLNFWREAHFYMTDKEIEEAVSGTLPMRASATIKALANAVDSYIQSFYTGSYAFGGVAGTAPFASTATAFLDARKQLNFQLADNAGRSVVLDAVAEGNAVGLSQFFKADERGDQGGIIEGNIGRKYGANWFLDQNIGSHSAGTLTADVAIAPVAATAVGASSVACEGASGTGTLVVGDLFQITGHDQQYVINAVATAAGTLVTLTFDPSLQKAWATADPATFIATHVVNLYFARDAFAWASRPLARSQIAGLGSMFETVVDPLSGVALRLEVSRQYKQTLWQWDILGGAQIVRPELVARVLG